jgi:hypothetical protein
MSESVDRAKQIALPHIGGPHPLKPEYSKMAKREFALSACLQVGTSALSCL